jgi:D-glycero-alpha-D-manno-heptose 1-phosphate guanylyltransferase
MPDAARYGTVVTDKDHTIVSFKEKTNLPQQGTINGGTYILDKKMYLENTPASDNFSIEKDFFEKQLNKIALKGFEFDSYFIDIGIPEDYAKAQNDFKRFKYK